MIVTAIRTVILYIFITIGIRLMGKRQIGDMQPNELVVTLLISEITALPLQDVNQPLINGIVAVFVLVILEIVISIITMKCYRFRKVMNGKSAVIIANGKIDQAVMKRVRMTVIDLIEQLRGQDVFDISNVAYAVLEVNGQLNVLLKSDFQPATAGDLGIKNKASHLQIPVISDGTVLEDALDSIGSNKKKLKALLESKKLTAKEILLMTLNRKGEMNIIKKDENT